MKLIVLLSLINLNVFAQNYVEYYRVINRIDEDVLKGNFHRAIQRFDSLYNDFDFIYSRHCFKALQICGVARDSVNARKWLEKSFVQGVPRWMVRVNELTKDVLQFSTVKGTVAHYDSLRSIYANSINHELRSRIDSLFEIDQGYTTKVNDGFLLFRGTYHAIRWLRNNRRQFEVLNRMMDERGYPGERMIGLPAEIEDSAQCVDYFRHNGPFLGETKAYVMLIHYFSSPRADINEKLFRNVEIGNLPPSQFGAINDFMAAWGKGKFGNFAFYNVWHNDPDHSHSTEIDMRRRAVGLNGLEQQVRMNAIWEERRKRGVLNSEIILH